MRYFFYPICALIVVAFALLDLGVDAFAQTAVGASPTNRDCSIASLSGSSQSLLAAANYQRKTLSICNFGSASVGVNLAGGTAAIGGAGTFTLPTSGGFAAQCLFLGGSGNLPPPSNVITVIGTSSDAVQCIEGR